jgi:hypothetical protein
MSCKGEYGGRREGPWKSFCVFISQCGFYLIVEGLAHHAKGEQNEEAHGIHQIGLVKIIF